MDEQEGKREGWLGESLHHISLKIIIEPDARLQDDRPKYHWVGIVCNDADVLQCIDAGDDNVM